MIKNLTNVRGIQCWGAHSGVKSLRRDLALIYSEKPAAAAAVFTQNQVVAAPIVVSKEQIANGQAQAIVINAGNANACTGEEGLKGARAMVKAAAKAWKIDPSDVLVASTGIIGEPFPTETIVKGIEEHAPKVASKSSAGSFCANAILTTDTFAKEGFVEFSLDDCEVNMAGIAKGSGMIHPNMATMLAFLVTDAAIDHQLLQSTLKELCDDSFNMITVDGDTSTNDMVAILANGMAGNDCIDSKNHPDYPEFRKRMGEMMKHLARLIVSDGEGASKFVEYRVSGLESKAEARKLARSMAASSLVKTAMFGRDPNWGRLICAAGNADVPFDYTQANLYLGDAETLVKVLEAGVPQSYQKNSMKKLLRGSHIRVHLVAGKGPEEATAWGSDLTTDYVLFNSVYTT